MSAVNLLNRSLAIFASENGLMVSVQNPVRLDEGSEPEPDLALITAGPRAELPSFEDTSLVLEVSDALPDCDRNVKPPLYAETRILEAWIVDPQARNIEVYSRSEDDTYREKRTFGDGDEIVSATLDELTVSANEVLA